MASLPITYFNSIKVRLKQMSETDYTKLATFQFHKGTIETTPTEGYCRPLLFQFHKGTIETQRGNGTSTTSTEISIP